jgi:hypothetical protein
VYAAFDDCGWKLKAVLADVSPGDKDERQFMGLIYDLKDQREQIYTDKFLSLADSHGISIRYTTDRAALDIGLHLTAPLDTRFRDVMENVTMFLTGHDRLEYARVGLR